MKIKYKILGAICFVIGTCTVGIFNNWITKGMYAHWISIYLMVFAWTLSLLIFTHNKNYREIKILQN